MFRKEIHTVIIFFVRINNPRSKPFSVVLPVNRFWFLHCPIKRSFWLKYNDSGNKYNSLLDVTNKTKQFTNLLLSSIAIIFIYRLCKMKNGQSHIASSYHRSNQTFCLIHKHIKLPHITSSHYMFSIHRNPYYLTKHDSVSLNTHININRFKESKTTTPTAQNIQTLHLVHKNRSPSH